MAEPEPPVVGDLERWQWRTPRPGTQGDFRGDECLVADLSHAASDELERSLRFVSKRRRGRPIVYRESRQIEGDGDEDDEDRVVAAAAKISDPEVTTEIVGIRELRALRQTLNADIDARRRELDRVEGQIKTAREERDKELARMRDQVIEADRHARQMVKETWEHYDGQLRNVRTTRSELEQQATADMRQHGDQVRLLVEAKKSMNQILRGPMFMEFVGQVKDGIVAAAESPIADNINAMLAAQTAAFLTKRRKARDPKAEVLEAEDVLLGHALRGRKGRARHEALLELKTEIGIDPAKVDLLVMGIEYFVGEVQIKTVIKYVSREASVVQVAR